MELLLMQQNYSRVVYLGDGAGDFCPSLRLGPRDFVLSREFYPTGAYPGNPGSLAYRWFLGRPEPY